MKQAIFHPLTSVTVSGAIKTTALDVDKISADQATQTWDALPAPSCPVCAGTTHWFDVVDFNKNGSEPRGVFLPLAGRPV